MENPGCERRGLGCKQIALLFLALLLGGVDVHACETLESCIAKYPDVARSPRDAGISQRDLIDKVLGYGADAIPLVIDLLESSDPDVRELAGDTLRVFDGLGAEHLDALLRARQNGVGSMLPAIARVGTDEAIEVLIAALRERPIRHGSLVYAFEILGETGAAHVAELYACTDDCREYVFNNASLVLSELEDDANAVVQRLIDIARDNRFAQISRQYAIRAIGRIGHSAQHVDVELVALRTQQPFLTNAVDWALVGIGSAEALPALLLALPSDPDYYLYDIESLGRNGYKAGPAVLTYLSGANWKLRVSAARTLGHIFYSPASLELANALYNEDDWRLVHTAIEALARLGSTDSLGPLKRISVAHWYPPVRKLADSAYEHIKYGVALELGKWPDEQLPCQAFGGGQLHEPDGTKLYAPADEAHLKKLTYDSEIYSFGAAEGTQPDDQGIIEVTLDNMVTHTTEIRQAPDLALKVLDGWLVGASRGEWGGELVHISEAGDSTYLYDGNIEDIFRVGDQLVAVSGLAHMGLNYGMLVRIDEATPGKHVAVPWKRLPAAPISSWLLENGELLINTRRHGGVVANSSGSLRMAPCVSR